MVPTPARTVSTLVRWTGASLRAAWRRLAWELRDALELVLLPGAAAALPWPLGFAWLRAWARWPGLYRERCALALAAARAEGLAPDERAWLCEHRLMMLIDHADLYLSRTRSDRWLRRYVDATGDWGVQSGPALLVTFHWAAGMWAHRHARASGLRPHMLLARPGPADGAVRWVQHGYGVQRARAVALADGQDVIFVPGALRAVLAAWQAGEQVIVVIDVPPDQVARTAPQRVLGRTVHMPAELPRLAVERGIPTTVFTLGFDAATGRRDLQLHPLGVCRDAAVLSRRIFEHFDRTVRARPACWHLWSVADRFFAPAAQSPAVPAGAGAGAAVVDDASP